MSVNPIPIYDVTVRWQSDVDKFRTWLKARNLKSCNPIDILDSLPAATSFTFRNTPESGQDAAKIYLGRRKLVDNTWVEVWAYLVPSDTDLNVPVLIQEEVTIKDGKSWRAKRQATSLLRKAADLCPPFCFLQYDPDPRKTYGKHVRDMLCALVLYYFLVAGVSDEALRWRKFKGELERALKVINRSADYQQWVCGDSEDSQVTLDTGAEAQGGLQDVEEPGESLDTQDEAELTLPDDAFSIRSEGSAVTATRSTALATLVHDLRDKNKFHLLNAIPSTPVYIHPQTIYPTPATFSFRMLVGTWSPQKASLTMLNVYAYLEDCPNVKYSSRAIKLYVHDAAEELKTALRVDHLEEINLLKPFRLLPFTHKGGAKQLGTKLNMLIRYYFLLAENEGLIGNPGLSHNEGVLKNISAICKDFKRLNKPLLGNDGEKKKTSKACHQHEQAAEEDEQEHEAMDAVTTSDPLHSLFSPNVTGASLLHNKPLYGSSLNIHGAGPLPDHNLVSQGPLSDSVINEDVARMSQIDDSYSASVSSDVEADKDPKHGQEIEWELDEAEEGSRSVRMANVATETKVISLRSDSISSTASSPIIIHDYPRASVDELYDSEMGSIEMDISIEEDGDEAEGYSTAEKMQALGERSITDELEAHGKSSDEPSHSQVSVSPTCFTPTKKYEMEDRVLNKTRLSEDFANEIAPEAQVEVLRSVSSPEFTNLEGAMDVEEPLDEQDAGENATHKEPVAEVPTHTGLNHSYPTSTSAPSNVDRDTPATSLSKPPRPKIRLARKPGQPAVQRKAIDYYAESHPVQITHASEFVPGESGALHDEGERSARSSPYAYEMEDRQPIIVNGRPYRIHGNPWPDGSL